MHQMKSIIRDVFIPAWTCRAYTLGEKFRIWKSKFSFLPGTGLHNELLGSDYRELVPGLEVPVYFLSGAYDYTVNIDLARGYHDQIKAPLKGFYTFEHSAHSPLFEEPDRCREILTRDVLQGRNDLADTY